METVPGELLHDPPVLKDVPLELRVHMGHHTSRWNLANQRYIPEMRADIHTIRLEQTAAYLRWAVCVSLDTLAASSGPESPSGCTASPRASSHGRPRYLCRGFISILIQG